MIAGMLAFFFALLYRLFGFHRRHRHHRYATLDSSRATTAVTLLRLL